MTLGSITRYRPLLFLCGSGCTRPPSIEGWASFSDIFFDRHDNCRYVIVESLTPLLEVWDFFRLPDSFVSRSTFERPRSIVVDMGALREFDALVMKRMALYDRKY